MAIFNRALVILKVFLGVKESKDIPKRGSITAIGGVFFYFSDYLLMVIAASIVATLRYYNWSIFEIFFLLWPGNILVGYLIIIANDGSGIDFTFFQGYSRVITEFQLKRQTSKILKIIITVPVSAFLVFWQGAAPIIIFLKTRKNIAKGILTFILISVSGLQMAIWTWLYVYGYEGVSDIIHLIRNK